MNPSLTAIANAIRVGDYLLQRLEQNLTELNRMGIPKDWQICFTLRAGQEASMHGEAVV